jgi:urease accessory protein
MEFMLITEKLGNLSAFHDEGRVIDRLPLEWHETGKRSLRKQTGSGRDVKLHLPAGAPHLQQDDVLFADANCLVVVEILACEALVLKFSNLYQAARACYAIGNKSLPLFFEEDVLLLPYESSAYTLLQEAGFEPQLENRKLLHRLKVASLEPASRSTNREGFFSRIFKLSPASIE